MESLSQREEQILLTIGFLQEEAYLVGIKKHLSTIMGKELSIGAVHIPLRRMERSGLISFFLGKSTSIRGGRRKKIYYLTSSGLAALEHNKKINDLLWRNFKKVVPLTDS